MQAGPGRALACRGGEAPGGPAALAQDVLEDPHVAALGYLQRVPFPGVPTPVPIVDTPFRLSVTPGAIRPRAPLLGEHTDAILAEIGYGAAEIADLRAPRSSEA